MKKKIIGKRLRIGIDIDNVIADSYPAYLHRYNQKFGTKIRWEEVTDFYFSTRETDSKDSREYIYSLIESEVFQMEIVPYIDAATVINRWNNNGYQIHYVTARPLSSREVTKAWLKKHGFWTKGATLDMYDESKQTNDIDYKKGVVLEKKIDLMIEDAKEIAQALEIPVLLLDRPWNSGELPSYVTRVKDWTEIEGIVSDL